MRVTDGAVRAGVRAHACKVAPLAVCADGLWLVSGYSGGEATLWAAGAARPGEAAHSVVWVRRRTVGGGLGAEVLRRRRGHGPQI